MKKAKNRSTSWFKQILNLLYKNKQIMSNDTLEEIKQYQWVKGDNFGKVVEVDKEDDQFLYFTDGSQIFKNVVKEFLEEVKDGNLPFPGGDEIAAKIEESVETVIEAPKATIQVSSPKTTSNLSKVDNPLKQLVSKLSKKNVESFSTTFGLNIPSKDIFSMLNETFEDDSSELIDVITQSAIDQIEINKLQEFLKEEVTNYIKNYYNV